MPAKKQTKKQKKHPNLDIITTERAREIGRKGGLANKNNPVSKLAARLRELKKKGLTDETAELLHDIMKVPDISSLDILIHLQKLKKDAKTFKEREIAGKALLDWHRTTHGERIKTESVNLNVNLDVSVEETDKMIIDILSKK